MPQMSNFSWNVSTFMTFLIYLYVVFGLLGVLYYFSDLSKKKLVLYYFSLFV